MSEAKTVINIALVGDPEAIRLGMASILDASRKSEIGFSRSPLSSNQIDDKSQANTSKLEFDFCEVSFRLFNLKDPNCETRDVNFHGSIAIWDKRNNNDDYGPLEQTDKTVNLDDFQSIDDLIKTNNYAIAIKDASSNFLIEMCTRFFSVLNRISSQKSQTIISPEEMKSFNNAFNEVFLPSNKHQSRNTRAPLFGMIFSAIATIVVFTVLGVLGFIATPFIAIPIFFGVLTVVLLAMNEVTSSGNGGEDNPKDGQRKLPQDENSGYESARHQQEPLLATKSRRAVPIPLSNNELIQFFIKLMEANNIDIKGFSFHILYGSIVRIYPENYSQKTEETCKSQIEKLAKTLKKTFPDDDNIFILIVDGRRGDSCPRINMEISNLRKFIEKNSLSNDTDSELRL